MTQGELTLVASLGSSALTGLVAVGVMLLTERRRNAADSAQRLLSAVNEILTISLTISLRAQQWGALAKAYASVSMRLDVFLRINRPLDLQQLFEPMLEDHERLSEAISQLWVVADQELVRRANRVAVLVANLSDIVMPSPSRSPLQRLARGWISAHVDDVASATHDLATARKELAAETRARFGKTPIDVFA